MKTRYTTNRSLLTLFAFIFFMLSISASPLKAAELNDSLQVGVSLMPPDNPDNFEPNRKLMFLGFGELTFHSLSVDGNTSVFELSNPSLNEDFTANYRASLLADGNLGKKFFLRGVTVFDSRIDREYHFSDPSIFRLRMSLKSTEPLWDDWRFSGNSLYDPNHLWDYGNLDSRLLTQPQAGARMEAYARLESGKYGYVEGGTLNPTFKNSKFTLYNRSLFGLYADLHSGAIGAEAVGGKLDGKRLREGTSIGIRADGTSGPYYLSNTPVTRDSDEIVIEVRDRFNLTTTLSTKRLLRDVDYNIDYERGRVILHQPVPSETAASDPIYIVITYDHQQENNDELLGSRLKYSTDEISSSFSILHRIEDANASGVGMSEPEDLLAGDLALDLDRLGTGYLEMAGSESDLYTDDNSALRAGWKADLTDQLGVSADYQRVEDNFASFGNASLVPVTNQQRLNTKGKFDLNDEQTITASYQNIRGLLANGIHNPYPGRRDEDIYSVGFKDKMSDNFGFGVRLEQRNVENLDVATYEKNRQRRLLVNIGGNRDKFGPINFFEYGLHYEYISYSNLLAGGLGNNNTNLIALTFATQPKQGTRFELTQRLKLKKDSDLDEWSDREDATFMRFRWQPSDNLTTSLSTEYKRSSDPANDLSLWQDGPNKIIKAGAASIEYIPSTQVKALAKYTRYDLDQITDSVIDRTDDFLLGQVSYFFTHHFSLGIESEYHRKYGYGIPGALVKNWDVGLRLNWNRDRLNQLTGGLIRRWQYRDNLTDNASSYILLVNGSISITENFFALAAMKKMLLRNLINDDETHLRFEVGYENPRLFRVSLGYERISNDLDELFPDNYFRGHGLFTRIVAKF